MCRQTSARLAALLLGLLLLGLPACEKAPDEPAGASSGQSSGISSAAASSEVVDRPSADDTLQYEDPSEIIASFPDYSFDSTALVIATDPASSLLTHRPMLSAALSDSYSAIEKKYNTVIYPQTYGKDALYEACQKAVTDGTYFADLVAIPLSELPRYQKAGLLMPLRQLPFLKNTDRGLDPAAMEALSVDGEQYALLGSGSLSQLGITTLFCNLDLLRELGIGEDPVALAREGKWTWERLCAILEAAEKTEFNGKLLGTSMDAERLKKAVKACFATPAEGDAVCGSLPLAGMPVGSEASRAFNDGKLLFLLTTVDAMYEYPHSAGVWSCLPLPKVAEDDAGYRCLYDPESCYVYVVLQRNLRTDYAGLFLHAISAAADGSCLSSLAYELLSGYVRTESSIEMLVTLLGSGAVS